MGGKKPRTCGATLTPSVGRPFPAILPHQSAANERKFFASAAWPTIERGEEKKKKKEEEQEEEEEEKKEKKEETKKKKKKKKNY